MKPGMTAPDMRDLVPKLREIGFRAWDPLGVASAWEDGDAMADEYDSHLLRAVSAAANGRDAQTICALLRDAEIQMGLEDGGSADRRAMVAAALLELAVRPPGWRPGRQCGHGGPRASLADRAGQSRVEQEATDDRVCSGFTPRGE